jgi:hypothetical protein
MFAVGRVDPSSAEWLDAIGEKELAEATRKEHERYASGRG